MRYVSTRGGAPELGFEDALLTGLASDGGLYVPREWPEWDAAKWRGLRGLPYDELAFEVMRPFIADALSEPDLRRLLSEAYAQFGHAAVAPLRQIGPGEWVMELFHGPTLAFKDYPLQVVGRLFDRCLTRRGERIAVVVATSGDTGSAAIEACVGRTAVDIFVLHPHERTSEVQRRQMTAVAAGNVGNIALRGAFDDCQDLVKAMFADPEFRERVSMGAMNSINWGRVMSQIVYYVHAALSLGAPDREIAFSVPTGNFGNIFAGYAAGRMGLPIHRLVIAANANDILARFFRNRDMSVAAVKPTISPSMDIQVPSNFERLLFEGLGRDGAKLADRMTGFRQTGAMHVEPEEWARIRAGFDAYAQDDDATRRTIGQTYEATGEILDPHSAVGLGAARLAREAGTVGPDVPVVALACAHPAKFPAAVERACGVKPGLPPHLADLYEREERYTILPNDLSCVREHILETLTARGRNLPQPMGKTAGAA